jgi:Zn-dependent protease|tara:strand:- start:4938 stop:5570 length:633 start_codon:yes stop_codon:yes gene_type:complete
MKLFGKSDTKIRIHHTSILLNIIVAAVLLINLELYHAAYIMCIYIGIQASVFIHELSHAFVASIYKMKTESITLYPFGGMAQVCMDTRIKYSELFISIAGPASNILIAGALVPFIIFEVPILYEIGVLNFITAFFNMIPAYPMDGGRALRSILSSRLGHIYATKISITVSLLISILIFGLGVVISPWLFFISAPLLFMIHLEYKNIKLLN